ncbi:MAG: hypothetical protein OHK0039_11300 [Bacteroidia bacterium]
MPRHILILLLCAPLILGSCQLFRQAQGGSSVRAREALLEQTLAERVQFDRMSITGKAQIDIPDMDISGLGVSYRIHLLRDSVILVRVNKLVEVARIFMTRDSVYVVNKLDQTYMVLGYELAKTYTGLDADFGIFQDMLLGNFHPLPTDLIADRRSDPPRYTGSAAGTDFVYVLDADNRKVASINTTHEALGQASRISYTAFAAYGATQMPQQVMIELLRPQQGSVALTHKKVQINTDDISFSFELPDDYTRKDLR